MTIRLTYVIEYSCYLRELLSHQHFLHKLCQTLQRGTSSNWVILLNIAIKNLKTLIYLVIFIVSSDMELEDCCYDI